ncbi:MAG: hypothetical protein NTX16_14455 [Actinobacteria bacterium]|nr:hypothetical protein [Actinomycetota bacterium]
MRAPIRVAVLAAALVVTVGASGFVLAACGGSSAADSQAQLGPSGMPQPDSPMGDPGAMITQQLDALVEDGTISSAQQTAVVAAIKTSLPGGSGGAPQGAEPSPGAQPPSGARPPDRGAMFATALAALVERGTITAAQQAAIEAALAQGMPGAPSGAQPFTDGSST